MNTKAPSDSIIRTLAELPPDTVIYMAGLMKIFGRCDKSIKRAVRRGELPPPVRTFGQPTWTAGVLLDHLKARLEAAKRDAQRLERRISQLSG